MRVPMSVAAQVYRELLGQIRRDGHENLGTHAVVSGPRMVVVAARAMFEAGTSSLRRHLREAEREWQLPASMPSRPWSL